MKAKGRIVIRPTSVNHKVSEDDWKNIDGVQSLMIFGVGFTKEDIKWCDEHQEEEWECDIILIPRKKRHDLIGTGKGDDPNDLYYTCIGNSEAWAAETKCDYTGEKVKAMMQCL